MLRLVESKNFKSLRYISQPLRSFHVLIGPNASGKSTFLEVIQFISDIINRGIDRAILERASHLEELTFAGQGGDIEMALEAELPDRIKKVFNGKNYEAIRYEIQIGKREDVHVIKKERVVLLMPGAKHEVSKMPELFPDPAKEIPPTILIDRFRQQAYKRVISKKEDGNDNFYNELLGSSGKGWLPSFKLGPKKSALGNLPEDETKFPASTWFKLYLQKGVQMLVLNSMFIKKPSPPGLGVQFMSDGSNLPWVIEHLKKNNKKFTQWIEHLQVALPDIKDVSTVEREEDKHRYLKIKYSNGIEVPSWLVSDGMLRLMALTALAYVQDISGTYLVEEPENGIHPKAIECVYQSLSSIYSAQILLASHSPIILSLIQPEQLLCFSKTKDGVTDIIEGVLHPKLREWKGNPDIASLFASGILS